MFWFILNLLLISALAMTAAIVYTRYRTQQLSQTVRQQQQALQKTTNDLQQIQQNYHTLQQSQRHDSCTGLLNKNAFLTQLQQQFELSQKYHRPLTLLLLHISNSSQLLHQGQYDTFEQQLIKLKQCLQSCSRDADILGRLSENQFIVTLLDSDTTTHDLIKQRITDCHQQHELSLAIDTTTYAMQLDETLQNNLTQLFTRAYHRTNDD